MTSNEPGVFRPQLSIDRDFTIIPNAWIRNASLSPAANYLLIYLMTHEVGYEITFGQMQRETGLGIKGVRSALAELQTKSWLVMERTQKSNGQLGPYRYTLIESTVPQSTVVASTVAEGTDIKKNNLEENKVKETYAHSEKLFDEFWNAYPRKLDKAKAFRAFKSALKRATFEDILAGVIAYRNDPARNPDFTKYPATWLNSDSWENAAGSGVSPHTERNERERQRSAEFLAEQEKLKALSAPPPKCEHGMTIARCKQCLTSIS
jgi:predicted transcriptional regulator